MASDLVINTRSVADSGPFLGVLFWVPEAISIVVEPQGALTCRSLTLAVFDDLARFMNYYSLFCCLTAISIVVEPQVVLTCRSSTLTVLADSGPFHGLLLTFLGSRSDFHN